MKPRHPAILLVLLAQLALPPAFAAPANAAEDGSGWEIDLNGYNLTVIGEGDPDTPDLTGQNYKVIDENGNLVNVDVNWLLQVLVATFGNWYDLIN